MKTIKQMINAFDKQLIDTKKQIRAQTKKLVDYAQVQREYAQYLYSTQFIEHQIVAKSIARKAIRCYGWVYRSNPQKYQTIYAKVLVEWFDYMNLYKDYEVGIRFAEIALVFYKSLLQQHKQQYLPAYAKLLADYGYCLWRAGQDSKAQSLLSESLSLYKHLDSTQLLAYCRAQNRYAQCLQKENKKQADQVMETCLSLLSQAVNRQSLAFKAEKVSALALSIELQSDDLTALSQSEQLLPQYRELLALDFNVHAQDYVNFLISYANLSEANIWTDGYDGFYGDSPRLALTDQLLAETVTVGEQLVASETLYVGMGYLRSLKRYTEFLLEEDHYDRAVVVAKKAMDFANKVFNKENNLIATKTLDELNYARVCQLYAQALNEQGEDEKVIKIALQGIFWYEQLTLLDPYYLEELCSELYEPEDYTEALRDVGSYLDNAGETEQALIYFERAYRLAKRRYDKRQSWHHLERYLWMFNNYINLFNDNGNKKQALAYSKELLAITVKHYENKRTRGSYPPILVDAYGNNAYILAHNQRYEEALEQTKNALACNGLVWYGNGTSYRQNKAWLLGNLGIYQKNLGEAERGLKNVQKSLAIRLKLFEESPLPFLSELQSAHRHCSFILTEFGRFDEALVHRKQILALDKKREFTTSWFDRSEVKWLNWLMGKKVKPFKIVNVANEDLVPRDKQALNFTQYWLLTCFAPSYDYLTRALYYLINMDQDLQQDYLEELVILMSLVKTCGWVLPESLVITQDWQNDYQCYIKRRKGFVPSWMMTAAEKLAITLPDITI